MSFKTILNYSRHQTTVFLRTEQSVTFFHMPPALLDFLQRLQVAYAGQVVAARILQEGPSVLGSNGRVSHLRQSRIAFPALDGVCHNVAELVQVLSAKRFLQAKRTVHA